MSDPSFNLLTMTYLTNPIYKDMIEPKTVTKVDKSYNRNFRFYKKRIYEIVKDIFRKKTETLDKEVLDKFEEFSKSCIHYIQHQDKSSLVQDQLEFIEKDAERIMENSEYKNVNEILFSQQHKKTNNKTIETCLPIKKKKTKPKKKMILPKKQNIYDSSFRKVGKKKNINNKYDEDTKGKKKSKK